MSFTVPVSDARAAFDSSVVAFSRAVVSLQASDRVEGLMAQRRRAAAYTRSSMLLEQLRDVAAAVLSGSRTMGARRCQWQGHVFAPGDFLTIWAVENVVHHLDLLVGEPPPRCGLALARVTIEAVAQDPLPADWPDEQAVLIGSGRLPVAGDAGAIGARLPTPG